ncbi:DUF397 domain-containing protein [Amycolatopsis sp. NPDC005232]|uniref:DUF397 domain-containing protein n=1 Tax=Amycolatopsis sp. NPDC005232 TaxID=3157027 RepID=UPI0033BAEF56
MIAPSFTQATWRKSSYTTNESNCVEFAAWHKSCHSTDQSNCIEVAASSVEIGIRDTKDRAGGHLTVSPGAWVAFLSSAR